MVYVMMVFGFLLILFWLLTTVSQAQREREIEKRNETETKIKLQAFILAVKEIFPNSKIMHIRDRGALLENPLFNPERKKVGVIEISGDRSLKYTTNEPYYLIFVRVRIDDKIFEERENFVKDDSSVILETLQIMIDVVLAKEELNKRILATTY